MYFIRFKLLPTLIGLFITALFCWLYLSDHGSYWHFTNRLNNDIYDLKLRNVDESKQTAKNIVVIDIDEKSLKQIGRWPWPRNRIATLSQKLHADGAVVIAYDIIFSEEEQNPLDIIKHHLSNQSLDIPDYKILHNKLNNDKHFADALKQSDSVLGFVLTAGDEKIGQLPSPLIPLDTSMVNSLPLLKFSGYIAPIKLFEHAAKAAGYVSYVRDDDGVTRRVPLILNYDNHIYGSLALQTIKLYMLFDNVSIDKYKLDNNHYLIEGIKLGNYVIPTDSEARVYAPLMNIKNIPHYSAADIIAGKIPTADINGRIALIGFTAKGLTDQVATPINSALPGVYVHASIIQGIINKKFPQRPNWATGAEFISLIVIGIILSLLLPWLSPMWSLITTLMGYIIIFAADWTLWNKDYWIMHISSLLIMILVISIFNFLYGFLFERRLRKKFKNLFGQYVPPEHVQEIIKKSASQQQSMEGESREMTVLFSDICSFTTISEQLTAQQIKTLLNDFFTPISDIILSQKGTIDKYVGDQIIAFWGAPIENKHHEEAAILTAFEMIKKTNELAQQFTQQNLPTISIGVGINSGEMNVGDMGSQQRRAYTVLGDNVNIASRLEALTRSYGVPIIVGENTIANAPNICFMKLDCIYVKGKTKPVAIYQPICPMSDVTAEIKLKISEYEAALAAYTDGNWEQAKQLFEQLNHKYPDTILYNLFLQRMTELKNNPPNYWNGGVKRGPK